MTRDGKRFMNKDNISAIVTAVAVVSLITGFGIYFNYYGNASHSYMQQKQLEDTVDQSSTKSGGLINLKLNKAAFTSIDKSGFTKAPELAGVDHYINTENNQPTKLSDLKGKVVLLDFWDIHMHKLH